MIDRDASSAQMETAAAVRCAVGALAEPLAGTAAEDHAHLLVEHPGPWGRKAWEESDLPIDVRDGMTRAAAAAGVRLHLIRRHGRAPVDLPGEETGNDRTRSGALPVWAAHTRQGNTWLGSARLSRADDLLGLDLAAIARGDATGFEIHPGPIFLVCTNGRRDVCCAELGRPVAKALSAHHPELTWESNHLGGHRFAGALLTLPSGLAYGRLDAASAETVATATLGGDLVPAYLRGRGSHPHPVQAAEIALAQHLGDEGMDALTLVSTNVDADVGAVVFAHRGDLHTVRVVAEPGPELRTSCTDVAAKPTRVWRAIVGPQAAGSKDAARPSNTSQ